MMIGERAMPITSEIFDSAVILTLAGQYSAADLSEAIAAVVAKPGFKAGATLVYDVRESAVKPSWPSMRARADWIRSLHESGFSPRCAIVAPAGDVRFGLGRMLAI